MASPHLGASAKRAKNARVVLFSEPTRPLVFWGGFLGLRDGCRFTPNKKKKKYPGILGIANSIPSHIRTKTGFQEILESATCRSLDQW